jgi:hypothetical protein
LQKVLASKEFFGLQTQVGGPDAGLHTNRSWVAAMFTRFVRRGTAQTTGGPATTAEVDAQSQRLLDLYKTRRDTFVTSVLNTAEYKNLQADKYYQLVFGRNATPTEKTSWRSALANGSTYANLVAALFGSASFYNQAPTIVGGGSTASTNTWARAVFGRAFGTVPPANDPAVLSLAARAAQVGRTRAALEQVINSDAFRNKVIDDAFQAAFSRAATTAQKDAYRAFLASATTGANRWERILRDIMATGNVLVVGQTLTLPRDFWEVTN